MYTVCHIISSGIFFKEIIKVSKYELIQPQNHIIENKEKFNHQTKEPKQRTTTTKTFIIVMADWRN